MHDLMRNGDPRPRTVVVGHSRVLGFMIGLLVIQIVVVAGWGIEPAKRGLEDLERGTQPAQA